MPVWVHAGTACPLEADSSNVENIEPRNFSHERVARVPDMVGEIRDSCTRPSEMGVEVHGKTGCNIRRSRVTPSILDRE